MKRFTRAALLSLLLLGAAAPVHAGDEWCDTDPPVLIRTPGGNNVMVHVTPGVLGSQNSDALRATAISYVATPAVGGLATKVVISVTIPGSGFATRAKVSSGPFGAGTLYGSTTGTAGTTMTVPFTLNVP